MFGGKLDFISETISDALRVRIQEKQQSIVSFALLGKLGRTLRVLLSMLYLSYSTFLSVDG